MQPEVVGDIRPFSLTWTWNIVIESSSIWTRTASFLPPPREWWLAEVDPSTPDGVLSECVMRLLGWPFEAPNEFRDMASSVLQLATFFCFSLRFHKHFYITSTSIKTAPRHTDTSDTQTPTLHLSLLILIAVRARRNKKSGKCNFINTQNAAIKT